MAELYPIATGIVTQGGNCYWGPNTIYFDPDTGSSVNTNEMVEILWREGDFYYIRYQVGNTGNYKRAYYQCSKITITTGTVTTHTPPVAPGNYRYVCEGAATYYDPISMTSAGSLALIETIRLVGATIGDYELVEYDVNNSEDGKRRRAWFNKNKLNAMPVYNHTLYAHSGYTGSELPVAEQDWNALYIFHYLTNIGFTVEAACAVLGNIKQECKMNPGGWEVTSNGQPDTVRGYGLMQWTPATDYLKRAKQDGIISATTDASAATAVNALADGDRYAIEKLMQSQLECMLWGFLAGNRWGNPANYNADNHTNITMTIYQFMNSTLDIRTLTVIFHDHYERSKDYDDVFGTDVGITFDPEKQGKLSCRVRFAEEFYEKFL